jgi:hypothetical protein
MSSPRRSLECRASLLALAIASAGASIHLALEVAVALWQSDVRAVPTRCPGSDTAPAPTQPPSTVSEPESLEAIELRCRAAGAARCEITEAMPFERALEVTASLFGTDVPDYAYLRFSPSHHRVVWTLRANQAGLSADVDAFDAGVVEFVAYGVTTQGDQPDDLLGDQAELDRMALLEDLEQNDTLRALVEGAKQHAATSVP